MKKDEKKVKEPFLCPYCGADAVTSAINGDTDTLECGGCGATHSTDFSDDVRHYND